jgi:pimeloyl-ACP methyl ester carboxylesterase
MYAENMILGFALLLIISLILSPYFSSIIFRQQKAAAQQYLETIKYRNLVIDLGNGVKTNAQLTLPAIGNGPFPAVLLVPGSGALDMNETLAQDAKPYWEISQYLSERGFVVLRYDKRGIGANSTIIDQNIWGNTTVFNLLQDGEKALDLLIKQPEVDPRRINLIGHSEGTILAPRLAIDNPTKIKNIALMGVVASNFLELAYYQKVTLAIEYVKEMLDKDHNGSFSIKEAIRDPLVGRFIAFNFGNNVTDAIDTTLTATSSREERGNDTNSMIIALDNRQIGIDNELKPLLVKSFENFTKGGIYSRCNDPEGCPIWFRSEISLEPTLSIIGNVSSSIGILLLNGENDTLTPVQQAFLLQQRLIEVNHTDHRLITYPNLGHVFHPSSLWFNEVGSIEQYVLADIYSWLVARNTIKMFLS